MSSSYSACILSMLPVLECRLGRNVLHETNKCRRHDTNRMVAYKHTIQHMIMVLMCRAYGILEQIADKE
jgi:hypothetical protein